MKAPTNPLRAATALLALLLLGTACAPAWPIGGREPGNVAAPGQPASVAIFPAISVAALQNTRLPGSIENDRGLKLGGVGSDLWRSPSDPPGAYWMATDRGPNGQVRAGGRNRRTFPVPTYSPLILQVRVDGSDVEILSSIPIVGRSGRPVTGLPNNEVQEVPYTFDAQTQLPRNPSGLDVEGLVRTPAGEFWAVDLSTISEMPDKIEGVAIVDRSTVAVANDNDFDIGNFDQAGNNVGQGIASKILLVTLPRPLP